jgi:hypothetical protein
MIIYIYALLDPDTDTVHYVGKTNNMSKRFSQHNRTIQVPKGPKEVWVNSLIANGKKPKMIKLEECVNGAGWESAEKRWIAHFRLSNASLTNVTPGGAGSTISRKKYATKTAPIGIPDDIRDQLNRMVQMTGRSQADIARAAINKYLEQFFD